MSQPKEDYKKKYYIVKDVKDQNGGLSAFTVPQFYPGGYISRPIIKIPMGPPMPYGTSMLNLPSGMVTPVKTSAITNMINGLMGYPSVNQSMSPTMNALISPSMRPISPVQISPLMSPMSPYMSQPFGSQPFGSQPFASQPFGSQPFGSQPFGSQPFINRPFTSQPFTSQPFASQPFMSQPVMSQPFVPTGANIMGSPILASNVLIPNNITIRIIGPIEEFYIRIPFRRMTSVIEKIYSSIGETKVDDKDKVQFNIITPTSNIVVSTSMKKMLDIIKDIHTDHSSYLNYAYPDGRTTTFPNIWNNLVNRLRTSGVISETNNDYVTLDF